MSQALSPARILVLMSGSVAAYKVCHVLSRLKQQGHDVEVVASPWALKFVGEATIEGLTGRAVHQSMFGSGAHMAHIHLIRWADLVILAPATANSINKLSQGLGDDLITTLFLAHDFKKPWLIAPAMNTKMYQHPVTHASIQKLKSMGCEILETASGVLACGEVGDGKLLDPDLILQEITRRLPSERPVENHETTSNASTPGRAKNVLVTSGGTIEPIDRVRSIINTSTGQTGARVAEYFLGQGHRVTYLHAESAALPRADEIGAEAFLKKISFRTFRDLQSSLETILRENFFDTVVHAAAVGDYSLSGEPSSEKTDSAEEMILILKKNPKLIESIRPWSKNRNVQLIAFKLTATTDENERRQRIDKILLAAKPDFLVANDISDLSRWSLLKSDGQTVAASDSRDDLAPALEGVL